MNEEIHIAENFREKLKIKIIIIMGVKDYERILCRY